MKNLRANILFSTKLIHSFGEGGEPSGKEILTGLLQTVFKLDDTKISEILADGRKPAEVLADITKLDTERVAKLKTETEKAIGKTKFQDGYNKGKSETMTGFETEVKEAYGIESDKQGLDLLAEAVAAKVKESGGTLTEEAIKTSPTYQSLEKKMKADLKKATDDGTTALNNLKSEYAKEKSFATVGEKAIGILTEMNPLISTNAKVAETHKNNFLSALKCYDYTLNDDGTIVVAQGGKVREDAHGNTLSYEDHVKEIAGGHFEFKQNNEGDNAGNDNDDDKGKPKPGKYPASIKTRPTNGKELSTALATEGLTTEDKRTVLETYKKETGSKK